MCAGWALLVLRCRTCRSHPGMPGAAFAAPETVPAWLVGMTWPGSLAAARRNACCTLAAGDGAVTGGLAAAAEASASVGGASAGLYHTSQTLNCAVAAV